MAVVIDDRLLLDVLAGQRSTHVGDRHQDVYTTSSWYYRLGRAVFSGSGSGSLSGRLATFGESTAERVRVRLMRLPSNVGLLHPRVVVPVMFTLRVRHPLNVLNAEALAVALMTRAQVLVTTPAPLLLTAGEELGLEVDVVD